MSKKNEQPVNPEVAEAEKKGRPLKPEILIDFGSKGSEFLKTYLEEAGLGLAAKLVVAIWSCFAEARSPLKQYPEESLWAVLDVIETVYEMGGRLDQQDGFTWTQIKGVEQKPLKLMPVVNNS